MCGVPDLWRWEALVTVAHPQVTHEPTKEWSRTLQGHGGTPPPVVTQTPTRTYEVPEGSAECELIDPRGLPPSGSTENGLWDSLCHSFYLSFHSLFLSVVHSLSALSLSLSPSFFHVFCLLSLPLSLSLSFSLSLSLSFILSRTLFHFLSSLFPSLSLSLSREREQES